MLGLTVKMRSALSVEFSSGRYVVKRTLKLSNCTKSNGYSEYYIVTNTDFNSLKFTFHSNFMQSAQRPTGS